MNFTREEKIKIYENILKTTTTENYIYKELIKLLKEVAEFRETRYIDEKDKVIILVPENYLRKEIFKDLLKDSDVK